MPSPTPAAWEGARLELAVEEELVGGVHPSVIEVAAPVDCSPASRLSPISKAVSVRAEP